MRRLLTLSLFALQGFAAAFAQNNGTGITGSGYYRVRNFASDRYIYVTDNKDYYDKVKDNQDFQAIQLWKDINKAVPDPASVIFITEVKSGQYDLRAQGTGVHALTGYYVNVSAETDGTYIVSATKEGVTKYLTDDRSNLSYEQGKMGTSGKLNFRKWVVDRIEANHATNYFGIKPTFTLDGKYYRPFYADFPFKPISQNMRVLYICEVKGKTAYTREIEGEVPANTPVIIECASTEPSDNRIELLQTTSAKVTDNRLSGVYFCNGERPEQSVDAYTAFDASTMRVFSTVDGEMVLTNDAPERLKEIVATDWTTEKDFNVNCIPANTSYLKVNVNTSAILSVDLKGTGINDIIKESTQDKKGVYSISGTHVRTTNDIKGLPAGLYIVGGAKVLIK